MKRGITTANAIIVAVIVIGSIFAINLLSSFSGVEDISGDITRVSVVGGFCGNKIVKTFSGTRTDVYICPSGSSCVNSNCVAITTTPTTQKQIINIVEGFLYTTEHEEMVSVSTKTCTSSPSFSPSTSYSYISCIDSDGGQNDKIVGFSESLFYGGTFLSSPDFEKLNISVNFFRCFKVIKKDYCGSYTDSVGNQIAYVMENYCENVHKAIRKDCLKGCSNGACIA